MNKNILDSIGNTPILNIEGIHVKCEYLNPSGSVKDRIAKYIIEKAEKKGLLKKGHTIVEATTGNTGTSLSMVGSIKGYKVLIFMPKGLSKERTQMMKSFGAKINFVPKNRADLAVKKARKIGQKKRYFFVDQFSNPWNIEEHQKNMSKEIMKKLKKVDAVVAGIGTGGTIIGLAKGLKKKNKLKVYGVEPSECALIYNKMHNKKTKCKNHKIEGIADGFIPDIISKNIDLIDDIVKIKSNDAIKEAKRIDKKHGCFVGISSGANLLAAKKVKKKLKTVVTLFPDEGEKYLSEKWFVE
tara:strand:+ start:1032 stop:1925 length:894 start_codon:yes stop_codon:yes gene_type:complete